MRVNDPHENATWVYEYDRGGNITSKKKYAYTTGTLGSVQQTIPYVYGDSTWKDKLTSYNGTTITYDAIGNPLSDGTWSYTWQAGRQLKKMTKSGVTVEFKYDHNGLRTQKKVSQDGVTTTTNYMLNGKLLMHMTVGTDKLHFFYDAQNRPTKVSYNSVIYTYLHNLQGDIVGIIDSNGTLVVEYCYDAWGNLLSAIGTNVATLGKLNPFRYRGYAYDEETKLYYLRSRYYNPELGRFMNTDIHCGNPAALISHNVYSYCSNTPIMLGDLDGRSGSWIGRIKGALAGAIKSVLSGNWFLNQVNCIAQRTYARRGGKLIGLSVSSKNITKEQEETRRDNVSNAIKWSKRVLLTPAGYALGDPISKVTNKLNIPEKVIKRLTTAAGWVASDIEDEITGFFIDSFTIERGEYTSICATFQYEHKHFIFLTCDADYVTYEIRNYNDSYYELWVNRHGCNTTSIESQKVSHLNIVD